MLANVSTELGNATTEGLGPLTIATVVGYFLLIWVTVTGNVLVILAFARDPTLQAITNYWIVSLAVTDIILAVTVMPLQVTRELNGGAWIWGSLMCDLFICLDVLNCSCSIYHLGLISLDRYLCVRFPIRYPSFRSPRRTLYAIGLTWLWCSLISLPRLWWKDVNPDPASCQMNNEEFMIFSSIISFYIPLFLISCLYYGIYRVTRQRSLKLKRELAASVRVQDYLHSQAPPTDAAQPCLPTLPSPHHHHRKGRHKKKRSDTEEDLSSTTNHGTLDHVRSFSSRALSLGCKLGFAG